MAEKSVGELIKEARTAVKLTQEQLAREAGNGLSASDISKAERGEADLSQASLKEIAKALGITQKSLLDAAKKITTGKTSSTGKTGSAGKTSTTGKTASTAKTGSTGKTSTAKKDDFSLTATEKKLVELYRAADSETKKEVMNLLKGTKNEGSELLQNLLGSALSSMMKK